MSDLTPPPEEPMPEQSRARIRADLLAAAQDRGVSRLHRWLVPGVAAAAVLLVVGMGAWVVRTGDGAADGGGPAGGTAHSSSPAGEETTEVPTELPSAPSEDPDVIESEETVTTPGDGQAVEAGGGDCQDELVNVLKGAEPAAAFPQSDGATTTFWVKGDRFVLCDERAGTTTVHQPLPLTPRQGVETYRVSSLFAPAKNGFTVHRVAGGLVPDGTTAFDVRYTFPDGHVEPATTTVDPQGRVWWRMVTSYHEDSGVNEMDLAPIRATVSFSGVQETYTLDWGVDTCAQANHGC